MERLPAREVPLPGESLASLLRRTSEAMGYKDLGYIASFVSDKSVPLWNASRSSDSAILDPLAALLATTSEQLLQLTVHAYANPLVLVPRQETPAQLSDSKTILRYFTASAPVCPHCLNDDPIPYERLTWTFKPAPVCADHQCLLIDRCPTCHRQLWPHRRLVQQCSCGSDIREWKVGSVSREAADLVKELFGWIRGDKLAINGISTAASFWWMDRVRACIEKKLACLQRTRIELALGLQMPDDVSWLAAASTLRDWPESFTSFLDSLQQTPDSANSGIGRRFGYLPRDAVKLESKGYSAPAEVIREYLLGQYTQGHLNRKVCLFKSATYRSRLSQRDWMTQTQAAKAIGLRHGCVRALIERGLLEGEVSNAGSRTVGLVRRGSMVRLRGELHNSLSRREVSVRLGIGPHQVLDLIRLELLCGIRTNRGWRILNHSVRAVEDLYERLPIATRVTAQWSTARQATRVHGACGLRFAQLWQRIASQQVRGRRLTGQATLKGLVVSTPDIERILPEVEAQYFQGRGYPLNKLAKSLLPGRPTKERVLKKWIEMGILHVRQSGRSLVCSHDEVQRFRDLYCLAAEACELLQISRASLARWETEDRLRPVYGKRVTAGAGFSLYRWPDIEQLKAQRDAGQFRRAA